jgi:hypothetical protein
MTGPVLVFMVCVLFGLVVIGSLDGSHHKGSQRNTKESEKSNKEKVSDVIILRGQGEVLQKGDEVVCAGDRAGGTSAVSAPAFRDGDGGRALRAKGGKKVPANAGPGRKTKRGSSGNWRVR